MPASENPPECAICDMTRESSAPKPYDSWEAWDLDLHHAEIERLRGEIKLLHSGVRQLVWLNGTKAIHGAAKGLIEGSEQRLRALTDSSTRREKEG